MAERPWLASYPPDVPHTLEPYPEKSLYTLLAEGAAEFPNNPATAFFGKHVSYADTVAQVEQLSRALASMGIGKGDRVGFLLPNSPQYVVSFYACQRLGAIAVGNNPLYTERELSHQLADAGIEVLIALDQLYPKVAAVRDQVGLREVVITKVTDAMKFPLNVLAPIKFKKEARHAGTPWPPVGPEAKVTWWQDLMRETYPDVPVAEVDARNDLASLVYTGGTTGVSKGAGLTHYNMLSNALQTASWFTDHERGREAMMCVLPFFHSYGLQAVMNVGIAMVGKLVLLPRFELGMALKAIAKEKPTYFPGVPRLYIAINESPETTKYDLSSIRSCFSGAAPLPVAVAEKFEAITGARLVEGYGLSETSPVTHINPIYGRRKFGTIGLPLPDTDCKIVSLDDPDVEMPPGEPGELAIAGPQVMAGYWNRPDETDEMIRVGVDGKRWLHTGDVAQIDEEGYFSIVDRKKDMILVSGFNVYPTDVEQVLYRHPKVLKAAVIGVPDEVTGEAVKAFIVLKEGEQATPEEILTWCRDEQHGLSAYRVPKQVEFRESLPETMIGKVLRRVLVEEERARTGSPS